MAEPQYFPGLEGVIAGETAICTLEGGLQYRGYAIEELARESSFVEVAYLLLHGELPGPEHLADFRAILAESAEVPDDILEFVANLPMHAAPMDVLRTAISALSHYDQQTDESTTVAQLGMATRLLAQIPVLIGHRYRSCRGLPPAESNDSLGFSANVLHLITGQEPGALEQKAMDVSLILYAEHEYNASTFTARVVASTRADLYSAITAAVGALKGPLHGGANERVMEILEEIGSPENATDWIEAALRDRRRIMGFGHRVYRSGDPRADILKEYCRKLAEIKGEEDLERTADAVEAVLKNEKGLHPNLDWPSARLYHYLGLETELYTPLFVASRVAGWCAHVIEQSENNRLIRPRSQYVGPAKRPYVPLPQRG